jgi:hypothetical protein
MPRGRPIKSKIRENIIEILYFLGEGYAYQIHKIYIDIFPAVTARSIYYHLKKGTDLNEFKVKDIKKVKGEYSWGPTAEKIYYALGPSARPQLNPVVRKYFEDKKK